MEHLQTLGHDSVNENQSVLNLRRRAIHFDEALLTLDLRGHFQVARGTLL